MPPLTLTVRYYLDNVLIDSFTPAQRLVRAPTPWRCF